MSTHPRRRLALALTLAGTLACGALAGPAMAADGADSSMRKAGGDPGTGYIIAVL
jgi:hypothetical protein